MQPVVQVFNVISNLCINPSAIGVFYKKMLESAITVEFRHILQVFIICFISHVHLCALRVIKCKQAKVIVVLKMICEETFPSVLELPLLSAMNSKSR